MRAKFILTNFACIANNWPIDMVITSNSWITRYVLSALDLDFLQLQLSAVQAHSFLVACCSMFGSAC